MAESTRIEWCDATFNPWTGCEKVSPACDHCYAESWAKRTGHPELWQGERRRTTDAYWRQPIKWDRHMEALRSVPGSRRMRVFCASLADVFDNQAPEEWRTDLFDLIRLTPLVDWLLLTKRPQNIWQMVEASSFGRVPPNVWLGTTVENQEEADRRIPHLLSVPARVHFLSCEPLLGELDLSIVPHPLSRDPPIDDVSDGVDPLRYQTRHVGWIISGDESGPHARETNPEWRTSLRDQCRAAGTAFFQKQITIRGRKVPFEDWPEDMRIREFP